MVRHLETVAVTGIGFCAVVALLLAGGTQPALASCSPLAVPFTSKPRPGVYSYIYAAGWGPNYLGVTYYGIPYDFYPALDTNSLLGVFWALGTGNPTVGPGDDNGTYPAVEWVTSRSDLPYLGYYGAYFLSQTSGWGTNFGIDGCVTNAPSGCMCVMLTQHFTTPQFLLTSAEILPNFSFEFNQPGNAPMVLAEIPKPIVSGGFRDPVTFDLHMEVVVPDPTLAANTGVYLDPGCDCGLQFRLKQVILPRGSPPPSDSDVANYIDVENPTPVPFGESAQVQSLCGAQDTDVWLATQLLAVDGFETGIVSDVCGPVECGPNVTFDIENCCTAGTMEACGTDVGECVSGTRTCEPAPALSCCDGFWGICQGDVGPAPEIVADGVDQDCDGFDDCYLDGDGDTFGSGAVIVGNDLDCNNTAGEADDSADCDDGSSTAFPGSAPNDGGACMEDSDGDDYGDDTPQGGVTAGTDCDDGDASTYPNAPEVFDAVDNQCSGDYGHGIIDENSGTSGFLNPANLDEYSWPAVTNATQYEYLRSNLADFAANCVTGTTSNTFWVDSVAPLSGEVFYYLNRPDGGSWGVGDSAERTAECAP